jgi:integrase
MSEADGGPLAEPTDAQLAALYADPEIRAALQSIRDASPEELAGALETTGLRAREAEAKANTAADVPKATVARRQQKAERLRAEFMEFLEQRPDLAYNLIALGLESIQAARAKRTRPAPPPPRAPRPTVWPRQDDGSLRMFATPEETEALLAAAHTTLLPLLRLQLASGLTRDDIRCLRWQDIDEAAGTIRLRKRTVALTDETRAALRRIRKDPTNVCPYLIVWASGDERFVPKSDMDTMWWRARRDSGARWRYLRLPKPLDLDGR